MSQGCPVASSSCQDVPWSASNGTAPVKAFASTLPARCQPSILSPYISTIPPSPNPPSSIHNVPLELSTTTTPLKLPHLSLSKSKPSEPFPPTIPGAINFNTSVLSLGSFLTKCVSAPIIKWLESR